MSLWSIWFSKTPRFSSFALGPFYLRSASYVDTEINTKSDLGHELPFIFDGLGRSPRRAVQAGPIQIDELVSKLQGLRLKDLEHIHEAGTLRDIRQVVSRASVQAATLRDWSINESCWMWNGQDKSMRRRSDSPKWSQGADLLVSPEQIEDAFLPTRYDLWRRNHPKFDKFRGRRKNLRFCFAFPRVTEHFG